ncbi:MAG TPA: hypothetical protein DIT01_04370 [Lentisphaeria bacterium]|nr:hypothetical protein [Lentisphaeria bacterium]
MSLLTLSNIAKSYDSGNDQVHVLQDLDLTVEAGESLAVVGPSGCGKSTLLNIIGALDRPSSGRFLFHDRDMEQLDDVALAQFRNREIGLIFQDHHLMPQLSVLENVLLPTLVPGAPTDPASATDIARDLLSQVGLAERLTHRPAQLSGGERQRVAVVRALINRPALLLADEPTGALDQQAADNLAELLVELNDQHQVALITVTHSAALAARMQRICELRNGTLVDRPAAQ